MPKTRRVQVTQELVMPDRTDPDRHVDLSSLFATPNVQALNIRVTALQPNPYQPRQEFSTQQLEELAEGIRMYGFLGTLLARPAPGQEETYQIAYGERRLRASKLAGLPTIPVIVRDLTDQDMIEIALTENVLRADLNPLEEAEGYRQMMDLFGYSERKLAERVGKHRSYIQHRLRILRAAPSVQQLVRDRPETLRYVAPLMAVKETRIREILVNEIREGQLISDDIEARAGQLAVELPREDTQHVTAPARPARQTSAERGMRPPRDRLSTATRALTGFMASKHIPLDEETAGRMLQLRELIDNYLRIWNTWETVKEPHDYQGSKTSRKLETDGSRVSHR